MLKRFPLIEVYVPYLVLLALLGLVTKSPYEYVVNAVVLTVFSAGFFLTLAVVNLRYAGKVIFALLYPLVPVLLSQLLVYGARLTATQGNVLAWDRGIITFHGFLFTYGFYGVAALVLLAVHLGLRAMKS